MHLQYTILYAIHYGTTVHEDSCFKEARVSPPFTIKKASILHYFTHLTTQSASVKFWKNRPFSFSFMIVTFLAQDRSNMGFSILSIQRKLRNFQAPLKTIAYE